jgi:erythromycin esterase
MLGEESHGSATTYMLKSRLVRFLHQEMGFKVIVWESGVTAVDQTEEAIKADQMSIADAVAKGVFDVWAHSTEIQPLFEYIKASKKTDCPLTLLGMDHQFSNSQAPGAFAEELGLFFNSSSAPSALKKLQESLNGWNEAGGYLKAPDKCDEIVRAADALLQELTINTTSLTKKHGSYAVKLCHLKISAIRQQAEVNRKYQGARETAIEQSNFRERAMARNLSFIAKTLHPGEKIIVWCNSFHALRNPEILETSKGAKRFAKIKTTGTDVYREFGSQLYTIAVIYNGGEISDNDFTNSIPLKPCPEGSLGFHLAKLSKDFLFLDLKNLPDKHWLKTEKFAAPVFAHGFWHSVWSENFDAFIFASASRPKTKLSQFRK